MRDLAAEAGYTNGALSHYFAGKDEILQTSFEHVLDTTNDRIDRSVGKAAGLKALRKMCAEIMPLTDEARLEARIAVSLWQRALTDRAMESVNNEAVAAWKSRLRQYWHEAIDNNELPPNDVATRVEALMTMMIGLQVTAALDPAATPRRAQLAMLDAVLMPAERPDR